MPPFFNPIERLTMLQIISWLKYILNFEPSKSSFAIVVTIAALLCGVVVYQDKENRKLNNEYMKERKESAIREGQIKDSAAALVQRIMKNSNDEITNFLKGELSKYEELKKVNDKIIKQSIK